MPEFNEEEYWENRKAGKRGHGELPKARIKYSLPGRMSWRRKDRDSKFTTKRTLGRIKTQAQRFAIMRKVKRVEIGEQERIAKKRAEPQSIKALMSR